MSKWFPAIWAIKNLPVHAVSRDNVSYKTALPQATGKLTASLGNLVIDESKSDCLRTVGPTDKTDKVLSRPIYLVMF